jgi:hypothetical protein
MRNPAGNPAQQIEQKEPKVPEGSFDIVTEHP